MDVIYAREGGGWLASAIREGSELRLSFAAGADQLHQPRAFRIPATEAHVEAIRSSLARHLLAHSALRGLADAAGFDPIDEEAAAGMLDAVLLAPEKQAEEWFWTGRFDLRFLIAHGGTPTLLERRQMFAALANATVHDSWERVRRWEASRR